MDETTDRFLDELRHLMRGRIGNIIEFLNNSGNRFDYVVDSVKISYNTLIKRVNGSYHVVENSINDLGTGDIKVRPYIKESISGNLLKYFDKITKIVNNIIKTITLTPIIIFLFILETSTTTSTYNNNISNKYNNWK